MSDIIRQLTSLNQEWLEKKGKRVTCRYGASTVVSGGDLFLSLIKCISACNSVPFRVFDEVGFETIVGEFKTGISGMTTYTALV